MITAEQFRAHNAVKEATMRRLFTPDNVCRMMRQAEIELLAIALDLHRTALELASAPQSELQRGIAARLPGWTARLDMPGAIMATLDPLAEYSEIQALFALLDSELDCWTRLSAAADPGLRDLLMVWRE